MCNELVHKTAVKAFKTIKGVMEILKNSKREQDANFTDENTRFLIRKMYGHDQFINYLICIVKEKDVPYCLSAWEVSARFKNLNEEIFYFIQSKMLLSHKTKWYCFPVYLSRAVVCEYDPDSIHDRYFSFLDSRTKRKNDKLVKGAGADQSSTPHTANSGGMGLLP